MAYGDSNDDVIDDVTWPCVTSSSTLITLSVLDFPTATVIALALISSRLDYANSVLYGSPSKNIAHLQKAQNASARVATQKPPHLSSLDILHELHSLPVQWHIKFKLATLHFTSHVFLFLTVFLVFSGHLPPLISYSPSHKLIFGSRSFCTAAPSIWNSLSDSLYLVHSKLSGGTSKDTFTKQLLTSPSGMLQHLQFTYVTNSALQVVSTYFLT